MSASRRPVSRRGSARPAGAAAGGGIAAGAIDGAVDEFDPLEPSAPPVARTDEPSAAAIRAARAEERRVRTDEPVQRSVLADRGDRLRGVFDDTKAELKKINWPDRETTRNLTIVVVGISVVLGLVLGGIDFILFQLFELMT